MAASTPPRSIFLYSFIFFFSLISSSATTASFAETNNNNIKKGDTDSSLGYDSFPKTQAQKLIRAFNLFPEHEVNQYDHDAITDTKHDFIGSSSRIFEKKFKFPFIEKSAAGVSVQDDLAHHAGYYHLNHSKSARMFYFFFESRSCKNDPVVIWLTGGPGCSSELALFYENGPFHITNNLTLTLNDYGWDKVSNLLYVDQPTGTGFSYTSDDADIRHNEEGVSDDLYDFLQAFFEEHSDYTNNSFYITGESYAGHYIPALASRINQGNKNKEGLPINLKGFAIGNGLTNPVIQYGAYTDYALHMSLIKRSDYNRMKKAVSRCQQAIKLCGADGGSPCVNAYTVCEQSIFNKILNLSGDINYYDIRKKCESELCYDFSSMKRFLNQQSVRKALGVGDISFVPCSDKVYEAMIPDWMRNLEVGIPALLEDGIELLVYAGEYDLICNWLGNSRWVHAMEWHGQKKFVNAQQVPFLVDGVTAGSGKGYGSLNFLKVSDAGHLVPMDQPNIAYNMLSRWMHGKLYLTQEDDHDLAHM